MAQKQSPECKINNFVAQLSWPVSRLCKTVDLFTSCALSLSPSWKPTRGWRGSLNIRDFLEWLSGPYIRFLLQSYHCQNDRGAIYFWKTQIHHSSILGRGYLALLALAFRHSHVKPGPRPEGKANCHTRHRMPENNLVHRVQKRLVVLTEAEEKCAYDGLWKLSLLVRSEKWESGMRCNFITFWGREVGMGKGQNITWNSIFLL